MTRTKSYYDHIWYVLEGREKYKQYDKENRKYF